MVKQPLADRFYSKFQRGAPDECWEWRACRGHFLGQKDRGYGLIRGEQTTKLLRAHCVAWELENGPIPGDMLVLHNCDNPACVNPNHLRLGTPEDNVFDQIKRGRFAHGERSGMATLTDEIVCHIRNSPLRNIDIARETGVDPSYVSRLRRWTRRRGLAMPRRAHA